MSAWFRHWTLEVCVLSFCLADISLVQGEEHQERTVRNEWKVGDKWRVDVTLYSHGWMASSSDPNVEAEKNTPRILSRYEVSIRIVSEESVMGNACWVLEFVPEGEVLEFMRNASYRVWVSKKTGDIRRLVRTPASDVDDPQLLEANGFTLLRNAPYGFPLEMIPTSSSATAEGRKLTVDNLSATLKESPLEDGYELALNLRYGADFGERPISAVRQKWANGGTWWSEFERLNQGHKELDARLK